MKLLIDVLNLTMKPKDLPDSSNWYEVKINDKMKLSANENDMVLIDNFYYDVKDLENKIQIENPDIKIYNLNKQKGIIKRNKENQTIEYENIVFATDSDLDGFRIRGILLSFFVKYAPDLIKTNHIYQLRTPIVVLKKGNKIIHYFMSFDEFNEWCNKNDVKQYKVDYKKGLGSWEKEELRDIFENNDINLFFDKFQWNKNLYKEIDKWFAPDKADMRKDKLMNNFFSIFNI